MAELIRTSRQAAQAGDPRPDPGERGGLHIADRAVERIVVAAAGEVDGAARLSGGLTRSYPRAEVVVAGDRVRAAVTVAGRWPTSAALLAADVRSTVTDQLRRLAGLRVDAVDVTVAAMVRADATHHRRVK
ncbi:Asp23/Gls24 family envelope stress response protein [Actinoplanes subglobosus]|uniref:Asp23/Gls24 family envelope stress response protein n=1 Tax=Actinoplanes subglobosus TaxID=1547892 RepID=A0ABV8JBB0_9ACTN